MDSIFPLRLQVYLARSGVASRRASEVLISSGRISVNDICVRTLGTKVMASDRVFLDGKPVLLEETRHYLMLNKPSGYLSSSKDSYGRPLALSLLGDVVQERVYNIGRLDYRSSGLLLFTNDGPLTRKLSHPSQRVEKEYLVETNGRIPDILITEFLHGIEVEGVCYQAESIERMGAKIVRIVLIEGKNREIRRVFSAFHLHIIQLHRVRFGPLVLGTLESGASRPLSREELESLQKMD